MENMLGVKFRKTLFYVKFMLKVLFRFQFIKNCSERLEKRCCCLRLLQCFIFMLYIIWLQYSIDKIF